MKLLRNVMSISVIALASAAGLYAYAASPTAKEDYVREPLPPGFQIVVTEYEGPVMADAKGRTIYKWAVRDLRSGAAGDQPGKPSCDDTVQRLNGGYQTPYPGGYELPELETRPSCAQAWPPVVASADAKPVGNWTIVDRPDGRKQWAYDNWPLYTSAADTQAGDVNGASLTDPDFDYGVTGAVRRPITPKANMPSQFVVRTTLQGRLITLGNGRSVYSSDRDSRHKSNCVNACLNEWEPILAADYAQQTGEWTTFERAPGLRQWAFRGLPVYRHIGDTRVMSLDGGEVAGWRNVYAQKAPPPPKGFVFKDVAIGTVLGDERGMTVYKYNCTDDASDQLLCDYPETAQSYRLAVCGGGDAERCLKTFPYAVAPVGAKTGSQLWSTMYINPKTGRRATAAEAGALNVWTFRGRPLYTFAGRDGYGDTTPADTNANGWGEFSGTRNGFKAFVFNEPAYTGQ